MRPENEAIIVIDVQNDFCPGGALAVAGGDEIVAPINGLVPEFAVRVFTQDWHPSDHSSFASQHPERDAFTRHTDGLMDPRFYGPTIASSVRMARHFTRIWTRVLRI